MSTGMGTGDESLTLPIDDPSLGCRQSFQVVFHSVIITSMMLRVNSFQFFIWSVEGILWGSHYVCSRNCFSRSGAFFQVDFDFFLSFLITQIQFQDQHVTGM